MRIDVDEWSYLEITPGEYALEWELMETNDVSSHMAASGHLKWDGCLNWQTSETCMAHACTPEDIDRFAAALKKLWSLGKGNIAHWNP